MRRPHPLLLVLALTVTPAQAGEAVYPDYGDPKAVFDFYFADPRHIGSGLYWIRAYMNPLTEAPYDLAPEFMGIVVVVHGTEIVTLARKNYEKYRDSVERMRYYASLGVQFKVCGMALSDFQYAHDDLYEFVDIVPSAMTELAYWQQQGYGLVVPQIKEKRFSIEEIR
jgi:intracellular sulfur oxidation DsrE/DsrF family protein